MKKLIYIANARMPTEKAHGIQIAKMCEGFASAGWKVELVLPWRFNKIKENLFIYYGVKKNFRIKKIFSLDLIPLNIPRIGFWIQSATFNKFVFFYLIFKKADLFYSRDSFSLYFLSFFKKNLVCELHTLPKNFSLHKRVLKKSKLIVVITGKIKEELVKKGISEGKILIAPDGVDLDQFGVMNRQKARRYLAENGYYLRPKVVLYSGHLYKWKGASVLAEAVKFLPDDISVIFVGGTQKDIEEFKEKYDNIGDIHVVGYRSHLFIPRWLGAADVVVLPNSGKKEISRDWTSPMKMFEYMASGRPIVASDLPSLREVLNKGNSFLVEPDNPKELARGIEFVLKNKDFSEKISSRALEDVREYSWQKRIEKINEKLD